MTKLTAIILTYNEEDTIARCLGSVDFADERLIIDSGSTDHTVAIAEKLGATVLHRPFDDYASQRNFALDKASNTWVLMIDADEVVSEALKNELQKTLAEGNADGYALPRIDYAFGKWLRHGEFEGFHLVRLAQKNSGTWVNPIHEVWNINGTVLPLQHPILHYSHPTITSFLTKLNRYTTADAESMFAQGISTSGISILTYPIAKFLSNYLLKFGFLDGTHGLIFCMLMAIYSGVKRAKLWIMWWEARQR